MWIKPCARQAPLIPKYGKAKTKRAGEDPARSYQVHN